VASVGNDPNFTPAEPPGLSANPVTRMREAADKVREDHARRMARAAEIAVTVVRPRWVVPFGIRPVASHETAQWHAAEHWQFTVNVAFTAVLLLVLGSVTAGILGHTLFMAAVTIVATVAVVKYVRIQLVRPGAGNGGNDS
jgi:hypothetical protein